MVHNQLLISLFLVAGLEIAGALECSSQPLAGRFVKNNPPSIPFFAATLDHRLAAVIMYTNHSNWDNLTGTSMGIDPWINTPYKKIISVGMLPESENTSAISLGANGNFNHHWHSFAQQIINKFGQEEVYIRLGWEANLWESHWAVNAGNRVQWIQYWRKIDSIFNLRIPNAKLVWCVGRDSNDGREGDPNGMLDTLFYPGDAHVDIIGVDSFDRYVSLASHPNNQEDVWNDMIYGRSVWQPSEGYGFVGLKFWSDFAKLHGKPLSIPEWGLAHESSSSGNSTTWGGDNPLYIKKMFEFITNPSHNVAFHIYTAHYHDAFLGEANQYQGLNLMPEGMAEYKRLFAPFYNHCDVTKPTWVGRKTLLLNTWNQAQ